MSAPRIVWLGWLIISIMAISLAFFASIFIGSVLKLEFPPLRDRTANNASQAAYFQEKFMRYAASTVGQPIEGYNADILLQAFPGLSPEDFEGVTTSEGEYRVRDGKPEFVRKETEFKTSAADAVTDEGYETLLDNTAQRFALEVKDRSSVNELLRRLIGSSSTEEDDIFTEILGIGETKLVGGASLTVNALIEDSRCPIDVRCPEEGTVRIRITYASDSGPTTTVVERGASFFTDSGRLTFEEVEPYELKTTDIVSPNSYRFIFSEGGRK